MKANTTRHPAAGNATGKRAPHRERGVHAASTRGHQPGPPDRVSAVIPRLKRAKARAPAHPGLPAKLWQLRLYVTGQTLRSVTALANLKQICESHLQGRYRITVVDLLKQPQLAQGDQILAIPTVVRRLPKPVRILIGNLSDTGRVLVGLDLRAAAEPEPRP
jgi:circadian clock protein KaiB